jgi:hypothetical protein
VYGDKMTKNIAVEFAIDDDKENEDEKLERKKKLSLMVNFFSVLPRV